MDRLKKKIIYFLIIIVSLIFFSNDFGLIDVEKASIVTAIAIDKEDDEYLITVQIALPESDALSVNDKTTAFAKGKTVAGAIEKIGAKTGWYQKLAFCNMIIIGESLLNEDVMSFLDYFSKNLKIQGSALLACTRGNASDVLQKATPLDKISGFALQKVILSRSGSSIEVYSTDVKAFTIGYFSRSKTSLMPYISVTPSSENESQSKNEESTKPTPTTNTFLSTYSKKNSQSDEVVFSLNQTAIFNQGKMVGLLNERETRALVYLKKNRKNTYLSIDDVIINGEKIDFNLNVLKSTRKISSEIVGGKFLYKVKENYFVKIADENATESLGKDDVVLTLPVELKQKAESDLVGDLIALSNKAKSLGADVLNFDELLYTRHQKYYNTLKNTLICDFMVEFDVTVHGQN